MPVDRRAIVFAVGLAACSSRDAPVREFATPGSGAPWTLTASDGSGLVLKRVDAKAVFAGPLAFTELHLYFHNGEARVREGRFQITLPAGAAVSRFAMENEGRWMEAEVVEQALARRAYDDFLHRGQDPALLEKAAGNQFTARVFPIPPNANKHLVISYSQTADQYVLPLRGLPTIARLDIELAVTGASGKPAVERMSRRNWRPDRDFVARSAARATAVAAGSLVVAQVHVGARPAALPSPPRGITLLVDTSASRAIGFNEYVGALRKLVDALRSRWGNSLPLQVVAFDQTTQQIFAGRAAGADLRPLVKRGAAGASDLGQALAWLAERGSPQSRVVVVTDAVITAGLDGPDLVKRAGQLARFGVERLDVVLAGELRDEPTAKLLARAALPQPGAVLDLGRDQVANALGEPIAADVPVEIAHSMWSYPKTIAAARAGTTAIIYARLDRPATTVDFIIDGRRVVVTPVAASAALVERAIAAAEIEELEAKLLATRSPEVRATLTAKSIASRVLSSQTSMLVLETEEDYARYQIDRKKLACTLVVARGGVACAERKDAVLLAVAEELPIAESRDTLRVTNSEITYGGELVATTESVLRDDSPTFKIDALSERLGRDGKVTLRVAPGTDPKLLNKIMNTTQSANVDIVMSAQTDADRQRAQEQLARLREEQRQARERLEQVRSNQLQEAPAELGPLGQSGVNQSALNDATDDFSVIQRALTSRDVKGALVKARAWHARERDNVLALVALGDALEAAHDDEGATRIYGSIIDLFPGRAELRRFAGQRLERIADRRPELARALMTDTYRRALADRPDQLTGHRLLAYALLRAGEPAEAFATIVGALEREYRGGSYRGADRVLADDAAMIGAAYAAAVPAQRPAIERALAKHKLAIASTPSTRVILYWETDANDVDLHIRDARGNHAFYEHKQLASGGELYADVTTGFGPECFAIVGHPAAGPYRIGVHYYSRGAMGYGMGMVEIQRFDGKGQLSFEHRPYVVVDDDAHVALGTF